MAASALTPRAVAQMRLRVRHLPFCLSVVLLVMLAGLATACGSNSEETPVPPECPPREPDASREAEAEALIAQIEDQRSLAREELPGRELRQVTALVPSGLAELGFFYTDSDGTGAYILPDGEGWRVGPDTPVAVELQTAALSPTELRHGMTSIVAAVEEQVPGMDVQAITLSRNEDCELEWLIGGRLVDSEGRTDEVVEGVVPDATAVFEETRRYDFPRAP